VSDRYRPTDDEAMSAWMRDFGDRLSRLELGLGFVGPLSLPSSVLLGDVSIEVLPTTGNGRKVVFTNTLTGATNTITL
jgi:hypothetical protein